MVIHAPKPRPVASGFWTFCDQTGDLRHVDAHAESTVCTRWPLLDHWHRNLIERGVDWLLNAAGAGRERLDAALRVPYPGSRLDGLPAVQSAFWYRLVHGLSGGATRRLFLGNGQAGSQLGLAVDDALNNREIAGWTGGTNQPIRVADPGTGPGRGTGGASTGAGGQRGGGGGGGGYAAAGGNGAVDRGQGGAGKGGEIVPAGWIFQAIISDSYTKENLGLGGGGGKGGKGQGGVRGGNGGNGGQGLLLASIGSIQEARSRSQTGSSGGQGQHQRDGGGGGGSGGLYLAIAATEYRLSSGITLACSGGGGGRAGTDSTAHGGAGGNGRVIICYGDSVDTSAGSISNAVPTTYQLLPSLPLGQVRVS